METHGRETGAFSNTAAQMGGAAFSAGGLGQAVRAAQPDESPSKIREAVSASEQLAAALHEALSHLESRLDPALTPQPPADSAGNQKSPTPIASHLLARIYALNDGLGFALQRIELLRRRVEV